MIKRRLKIIIWRNINEYLSVAQEIVDLIQNLLKVDFITKTYQSHFPLFSTCARMNCLAVI